MIKYMRIWVRALGVWILCIILSAIFFEQYIGIVNVIGITVLLGSFLLFAVSRVISFFLRKPLQSMEESIPAEEEMHVMAEMTGRTNQVTYAQRGRSSTTYMEYEITYKVQGKVYTKWFHMFPGPDLGDVYDKGQRVLISCNQKKPDQFIVVKIYEE